MKNMICWKLLGLLLIVVCFFGCGEVGNGDGPPDSSIVLRPPRRPPQNDEESDLEPEAVLAELEPEAVLAELEEILEELEEILEELGENVPVDEPIVQDLEPPKMTDSSIEDGAEDVGLNNVISVKFNEPIDTAEFTLQTENGDIVETRVIFRKETIEIKRLGRGEDFHLKPLTTYLVTGTASDAAGNKTEVEITFTTGEGFF